MKSSTSPKFNPLNRLTTIFAATLMIHAASRFILAAYSLTLAILLRSKTFVSLEDFARSHPYVALSMLLVLMISTLTFVMLIILFPTWFYQAYKNMESLKAFTISYGSWAPVYSWFVPVLCLFQPFQLAKEIWIESDPDFDPDLNFLSFTSKAASFISMWWVFWVITGIWSNIFLFTGYTSNTSLNIEFVLIADSITLIGTSLAAVYAVPMVKEIARRQRERFKRIVEYQNAGIEDNY